MTMILILKYERFIITITRVLVGIVTNPITQSTPLGLAAYAYAAAAFRPYRFCCCCYLRLLPLAAVADGVDDDLDD